MQHQHRQALARPFLEERIAGLWGRHKGRLPEAGAAKTEAPIIDWTLHRRPGDGSAALEQPQARRRARRQPHARGARLAEGRPPAPPPPALQGEQGPESEATAAGVIGLYLNPPANAAVFCVDEKTAIQTLDRLDPVLPLSPGRAGRNGFGYYRHETLSLCAALDTASGEVVGKTAARHTSAEFVAFLSGVVATQPAGKEVHIIADNLSAHKTKRVAAFLDGHASVHIRYTPTYASWLNQVEIWFSKIERDLIARGFFTSKSDLKRKITRYIRRYNKNAKHFKWTCRKTSRRIVA